MRKQALIILGCCFLLLGLLLLTGYVLVQGINDGEWSHINETGKFSGQDQVVWTAWQTGFGIRVQEFPGVQYALPEQGVLEYRQGTATGWLFDFTVYECRKTDGNPTKIVPATGTGWGAHYHGIWSFVAMLIGAILLLLGFLIRNPVKA